MTIDHTQNNKNAVRSIINIGRRIGKIFCGEPWNLANGPQNFEKFAAENCGP